MSAKSQDSPKVMSINSEICTLCGTCIEICPKDSLTIVNKKIVHLPDQCMLCSHCYAACPTGAISFDSNILQEVCFNTFAMKNMSPETLSPSQCAAFLLSRRSIRKYRNIPVPTDVLKDLISAAICAPSGSNCQQWEFTIVSGREKVLHLAYNIRDFFVQINAVVKNPLLRYLSVLFYGKALLHYYRDHYASVDFGLEAAKSGRDVLFHGAPAIIIVHSNMNASLPLEDGQYAAYNIALMAHAMGLGSCFIGYAAETINRSGKLKSIIGIPKENRILAVLAVGYPEITYKRFALRKPVNIHFV